MKEKPEAGSVGQGGSGVHQGYWRGGPPEVCTPLPGRGQARWPWAQAGMLLSSTQLLTFECLIGKELSPGCEYAKSKAGTEAASPQEGTGLGGKVGAAQG